MHSVFWKSWLLVIISVFQMGDGLAQENTRAGKWGFRSRLLWEVSSVENEVFVQPGEVRLLDDGSVCLHDLGLGKSFAFDGDGKFLSACDTNASTAIPFSFLEENSSLTASANFKNLPDGLTPQIVADYSESTNLVFWARSDQYLIHVCDYEGNELNSFGLDRKKKPFSEGMKDKYLEQLKLPGNKSEALKRSMPDTMALIKKIQVIDDLVYVFSVEEINHKPDFLPVDIFTLDGQYLYKGKLGLRRVDRYTPPIIDFALGNGRLYARTETADGVPVLAGYRINMPPAPTNDGLLLRPMRYAEEMPTIVDSLKVLLSQQEARPEGKGPLALVVPHYWPRALPVGASGFAQIKGLQYNRVVIIANSHRGDFKGIGIAPFDAWGSDEQKVFLSRDLADDLVRGDERINYDGRRHFTDHTIELIIPCLQEVLAGDFSIVPILFGNSYYIGEDVNDDYEVLADLLNKYLKPDDLLIISSDMTHNYPSEELTRKYDRQQLDLIQSGDLEGLIHLEHQLAVHEESHGKILNCAIDGIKTALEFQRLRGGGQRHVLAYGLTGEDWNYEKFCGFSSILLTEEKLPGQIPQSN